MLERLVVQCDPCDDSYTLGNSTELVRDFRASVCVLHIDNRSNLLLERLEKLHIVAPSRFWLLRHCGDEEKRALILEDLCNSCCLSCNGAADFITEIDVLLD